ncbi:MAG: DnaJ C-terminal domain-containing protein [Planctomycetia bacterium]|nr:DnaJ C-terminal domain-containing protein [Planctomycetia bacterium]
MAHDFYETLGVGRNATKEEIGKAYRAMARKYHPDLHPDDKTASKKFQEVQEAFDCLNDEKKRKLYDQYGADYEHIQEGGFPGGGGRGSSRSSRTRQNWTPPGGTGQWQHFSFEDMFGAGGAGASEGFDPRTIFGDFGGDFPNDFRGGSTRRRRAPTKGSDIVHDITIPFTKSILGGEESVGIQETSGVVKTVTAKIPPGIEDGKKLRLRGLGEASPNGGQPGDLVLVVRITPHPSFTRQGNNLLLRLPVTISEAVLGAKVSIPTPRGEGVLNIPPGTSSGKKLRVKGCGVPGKGGNGDLLVEILINAPTKISEEEAEVLRRLDQNYQGNLRSGIAWKENIP